MAGKQAFKDRALFLPFWYEGFLGPLRLSILMDGCRSDRQLLSLRPIVLEFELLANSEDPDKFTWRSFRGAQLLRNRPASTDSEFFD
ncbi:hypothetical protein GB937_007192 [Aspergillus fischeri]|nr:hypothetical protein GB937_007192 [Aspergillus fischeri]